MGLINTMRAIEDALSMTVKITSNQVDEITVRRLLEIYKAAIKRNEPNDIKQPFETVIRFFLEEDEFKEALQQIDSSKE